MAWKAHELPEAFVIQTPTPVGTVELQSLECLERAINAATVYKSFLYRM